jgi:glycosyltransferase involved in cell wall biosynthesis
VIVISPHVGLRTESTLGGEIYERALLTRLPRHGITLELGLPRSLAPPDHVPEWHVTLLRPARGLRWYVAPSAFVPYTTRLLRRGSVHLLRGHSVRYIGPSLFIARRLAGVNVPILLHHLHTDPPWRRLEGALLRRADAVITISETSRRQLLGLGVDERRISVIVPGVVAPTDDPIPQGATWGHASGLRLLFVGRLIQRKRPDIAVRCVASLAQRGLDVSLVIAGEGSLRASLEELARDLNVATRIRCLGPVSAAEKWGLYAAADVLLFPSDLEGFGFVAAEAQARGLPVIVSEKTAAVEIVQHGKTGFAVPGNAEAFAAGVLQLTDPVVRRHMAEHARASAERFNWDETAAAVATAYRRTAAAAGLLN